MAVGLIKINWQWGNPGHRHAGLVDCDGTFRAPNPLVRWKRPGASLSA